MMRGLQGWKCSKTPNRTNILPGDLRVPPTDLLPPEGKSDHLLNGLLTTMIPMSHKRSQENTLEAGRTAMYCPPDQFQIVTWVANTADLRCARIYCIISVLCWLDFKHQGFIGICVDCSVVVVVVVVCLTMCEADSTYLTIVQLFLSDYVLLIFIAYVCFFFRLLGSIN